MNVAFEQSMAAGIIAFPHFRLSTSRRAKAICRDGATAGQLLTIN